MPNTQSTNLDLNAALAEARTQFESMGSDLINAIMPGPWQMYTRSVNCPTGLWRNDFIANIPIMEAWTGSKVEKTLREYQQQLEAKPFAARLALKRRTFTRDSGGQVHQAIDDFFMGQEAVFDSEASASLHRNSGAGDAGYDGVSIFNASHPHFESGSGASNLSAGTNWSHANYSAARQVMANRKNERGQPVGPFVVSDVECHPTLTPRVKEVLEVSTVIKFTNSSGAETTSAGAVQNATAMDNIWEGDARIIENHRISTADQYHWTLMDNTKSQKLIFMILERSAETFSYTDMTDPERRDNDRYLFDMEADFTTGGGFWMLGYRGTGTQ